MTSREFEDYSQEIAACKAEMKSLQLTWKSPRVRAWVLARTGFSDPHYLNREDLQALARAIASSKTPEFYKAHLELTDLMEQVDLGFDSPVILAWMRREGILDDGFTISFVEQLASALRSINEGVV